MSLLRVSHLSLAINGQTILKDLSFAANEGQVLGIVGESGSGKSLSALSIMKLLPSGSQLQGRIDFDGRDIVTASEADMCDLRGDDIGMIFQEPMSALNPVQTIGDQVAETVLLHKKCSRAEALEVARETLDRVGLPASDFPLSRYPHELSGGQRQRVVIAMAIALRPRLLIADEPTTALDVTTQAQILELLKGLVREEGMALILISHDLAVVADMADEICIFKQGELVERGDADRFFVTMEHPYTQSLFDASNHQPQRGSTHTSAPDDHVLQAQGLVCTYPLPKSHPFARKRKFVAVDGVDLTIGRGESVGLVGESGCGKSTLARAILGLQSLDQGELSIHGQKIERKQEFSSEVRRNLQVVFQDPFGSFNPRHRVERLVAEPLFLDKTQPDATQRRERVAEALIEVQLQPDDMHKYIHEFSGGQRQRIAIARALITRPSLIILDEAVSALDVSIRAQIMDLLAQLSQRQNLSYLFVSHDLHVVRAITDRVLVMRKGKIVEAGATADIYARPQHAYTQSLLAAAPDLEKIVARRAASNGS